MRAVRSSPFAAPLRNLQLLRFTLAHICAVRASGTVSVQEESEGRGKTVKLAVSSLRIDTLAAAGLGISRQKIWEAALDNLLMLNGELIKKKSANVVDGDIIEVDTVLKREGGEEEGGRVSAVRRGRVEVMEIGERTRKGGYHVTVKRFKHFRTLPID
ncbi:hypothetical protein GBAR_LOCUS10736, partial [Geodia barretti]